MYWNWKCENCEIYLPYGEDCSGCQRKSPGDEMILKAAEGLMMKRRREKEEIPDAKRRKLELESLPESVCSTTANSSNRVTSNIQEELMMMFINLIGGGDQEEEED